MQLLYNEDRSSFFCLLDATPYPYASILYAIQRFTWIHRQHPPYFERGECPSGIIKKAKHMLVAFFDVCTLRNTESILKTDTQRFSFCDKEKGDFPVVQRLCLFARGYGLNACFVRKANSFRVESPCTIYFCNLLI